MSAMSTLNDVTATDLLSLVRLVDEYATTHDDGRAPAWRDLVFAEVRRRFDAIEEGNRIREAARAAREEQG